MRDRPAVEAGWLLRQPGEAARQRNAVIPLGRLLEALLLSRGRWQLRALVLSVRLVSSVLQWFCHHIWLWKYAT